MNAKIDTTPVKVPHTSNVGSIPVSYRYIHWFKTDNLRHGNQSWGDPLADLDFRFEPDEKTGNDKLVTSAPNGTEPLVRALFGGWHTSQGSVSVVKATKELIAAAIEDRKAIIAECEATTEKTPMAVVLRRLWCPDGKWIQPQWIGKNCYRRSLGIRGVILKRKLLSTDGKYDDDYEVPVTPKVFATELDELLDHVLENTGKRQGQKQLTPIDAFFIARKLLAAKPTAKESDLMNTLNFKRGEAQRAYALAKMDIEYPELNLAKCMLTPPGGSGAVFTIGESRIDVEKLRHADLVRLNLGHEPGTTGDKGKLEPGRRAKLDAIGEYITAAMTEGKPEVMGIAKVNDVLGGSPIHLFQYLRDLIQTNTLVAFCDANRDPAKYSEINKIFDKFGELDKAFQKIIDRETKPKAKK